MKIRSVSGSSPPTPVRKLRLTGLTLQNFLCQTSVACTRVIPIIEKMASGGAGVKGVTFSAVTKEFRTFKTCPPATDFLMPRAATWQRTQQACVQNDGAGTHTHALFVAGKLA